MGHSSDFGGRVVEDDRDAAAKPNGNQYVAGFTDLEIGDPNDHLPAVRPTHPARR